MDVRDLVAIASMCMTLGFGIGFVMVTRAMVKNLEIRVDRINGTPERVIAIEKDMQIVRRDVSHIWKTLEDIRKRSSGKNEKV